MSTLRLAQKQYAASIDRLIFTDENGRGISRTRFFREVPGESARRCWA
jgi:hypothetical protein